ncbi:MAG TPA: TonB-dependent receptor [Thermoanaerobaculales bacterium]|nr:TonB-dependent receptor [Thermoanaerobaculales bacterium]HQP42948.1 TonB-dependent receptor [Thermoanaerobaculales bacterium]
MSIRSVTPLLGLAILCSAAARGGDDWPPYFVGEVVVVAESDDPTAGPGTVTVLEADDIRRLGAATVADAVQHLAGASISVGARDEQRIWVRGYEPADVLVLLDGIPIADPYSGEVDLGQVPVGDVARIVLSRGAASPEYGPGGMGGVINIVTVQGAGAAGCSGDLEATGESTVRAHAAAGGAAGAADWYVGVGFESSEGWPLSGDFEPTPYEDGGRRANSDLERWSALARVGYGFGERGRLTATLRLIDSDKGIPFSTERPAGFVRFARFPEWRQATAALGWEGELGGSATLRAQLYGHRFDNTLDAYTSQDLDELSLESTFNDDVLGGWVVTNTTAGRHALSGALHLREDRHERLEALPGEEAEATERYTVRTGSLSAADRLALGARTALTLTAAVDDYQVASAWRADGLAGGEGSSTLFSPQAEFDVALGRDVAGSIAVYRRSRFPTLRQLYGGDVPNPDLAPQLATGASAGIDWRPGGRGRLAITAYADRVDDLITRRGRDFPYENQDRAELVGLELEARSGWRRVDLGLEAAVQQADFVESAQGLEEVPYVPEAAFDADLGVAVARRGDLRLHWAWVGTRVWYDGADRRELDPYQLLRVSLGWRWRGFALEAALDNALDADVEQEWGYPTAGRRLWVALHVGR